MIWLRWFGVGVEKVRSSDAMECEIVSWIMLQQWGKVLASYTPSGLLRCLRMARLHRNHVFVSISLYVSMAWERTSVWCPACGAIHILVP